MTTESRTGPGPRDRFRAQVREEVKAAALRQLAEGGPEALSLNAVAKQLGMTGPALYRYFANRDSLLTELVVDAYEALASALARAAGAPARDGAERLAAVVRAYRDWARTEPHRYRLLFRAPFKGYDAHSARLVEAAQRAMNVVLNVANALAAPGAAVPENARNQVQEWMERRGVDDVPPHGRLTDHEALGPSARSGEPGDRGQLRLHGHRSGPLLRSGGRRVHPRPLNPNMPWT